MNKTLRRWLISGCMVGACSIALFWQAPQVVNSNYWYLGFAMDGVAIVMPAALGMNIFRRMRRATKMAVLIYSQTKVWVSSWDCLTLPQMTGDELLERLAIFKADRELFESPLNVLRGKKVS
ncbi:MAG: hypothetical protein KME42_13930 [Tildeniella nuda ZEHNDER 1965/U140]|jgi:hypothetical protein|nr:hypothetical protein [Tildeniella nuda ZEHNDER 1965/U140]